MYNVARERGAAVGSCGLADVFLFVCGTGIEVYNVAIKRWGISCGMADLCSLCVGQVSKCTAWPEIEVGGWGFRVGWLTCVLLYVGGMADVCASVCGWEG